MLVNELYRKIIKRELNIEDDCTDFYIIWTALKNGYDIEELKELIENNRFTDKQLVLLSANSLEFFKKYVFNNYKASPKFMLDLFNETSLYPEEYFEFISPELKTNPEFLLNAIKYDGFIVLDSEVINSNVLNDSRIMQEIENYFSDKNLISIVADIEEKYEAFTKEFKKLEIEYDNEDEKDIVVSKDYRKELLLINEEREILSSQLELLKNLNAYKLQSQLKKD